MIKRILIAAGLIIVIAGATVGILYFIKHAHPAPVVAKTSVLDLSKDYGACTLLSTSAIKTVLGDAAANLQASKNMGITKDKYIGNDVKNVVSDSQSCVYAFVPGGTLGNGFNATNGFSVQKTIYTNNGGPAALISQMEDQIKLDPTATSQINSLGNAAFYTAATGAQGPGATNSFTLLVFTGTKSTQYMINQPADATTFTADTAETALMQLAK